MKCSKVLLVSVVFVLVAAIAVVAPLTAAKKDKPVVQMAILLDTSGSMEGLIEQAKSQLWKIVNTMATGKRKGQSPQLEVALYEYGKSTIPKSEGHLRMIVPMSRDLDLLSDELFKLKTNGGNEFCGQVIGAAVEGLKWSPSNKDYKVIFIAGNEPFTQGTVDYRKTCKAAIENGIIVNTIFCGNEQEGIKTNWKDGADLADGQYMNIDHNKKVVHIAAPQDKDLTELGRKLNETYLAYGAAGKKKKEMQKRQDANASSVGGVAMVQRSVAKASKQYSNVGWDLVDAEKEGAVKVEELEEDALPEEMKKMSPKERKKYVEEMTVKRDKIQKKIKVLKKERDTYIAKKRKQQAQDNTLDSAMITAIKQQAGKKNYKFEKE
jgi:hypothetical protein